MLNAINYFYIDNILLFLIYWAMVSGVVWLGECWHVLCGMLCCYERGIGTEDWLVLAYRSLCQCWTCSSVCQSWITLISVLLKGAAPSSALASGTEGTLLTSTWPCRTTSSTRLLRDSLLPSDSHKALITMLTCSHSRIPTGGWNKRMKSANRPRLRTPHLS